MITAGFKLTLRMRFARLSRIRGILGCPPQENKVPPDLNSVVEDDDYIIVDLVLNWVSLAKANAEFRS